VKPVASLEDAILIATRAHRGQRYPSPEGEPYVFHPLRVMMGCLDPIDQMAAVLHDVVEDTEIELGDLVEAGFPNDVVLAVDNLTHRTGESYDDYIERLATNEIARRVKIVDLRQNLSNNRRLPRSVENDDRIDRYEAALARLGAARVTRDGDSGHQYRRTGSYVVDSTTAGGDSHPGRLIMLNGGSSAGKSTLGRALQAELADPWLLVGIDLLIWTLPPEMINDQDGLSVREGVISRGERFMPLYLGFQTAVAALARSGVNVLVDDITIDGLADQDRWNHALRDLEVCWIGVNCAPEVAAAREAGRGGRLPAIARHQAWSVHRGVRYDVEVDTGALDLQGEIGVISEWLGRTWSITVSPRPTDHPTVPPSSGRTPGASTHPAPWEQ